MKSPCGYSILVTSASLTGNPKKWYDFVLLVGTVGINAVEFVWTAISVIRTTRCLTNGKTNAITSATSLSVFKTHFKPTLSSDLFKIILMENSNLLFDPVIFKCRIHTEMEYATYCELEMIPYILIEVKSS